MLSFSELSSLVHQTVGLRMREQGSDFVRVWLKERAAELGLSLADYLSLLREGDREGQRERELLTVRLTTGETYFFRDQPLFSLLSRELLPELIRSRSGLRKLKIWSAGCSTGEEAYSLAMLMNDCASLLDGWEVEIIASDINADAIQTARRGIYRDWSFRTMDGARLQKYFHRRGRYWEIDRSLLKNIRFVRHDLFKDAIPHPDIGLTAFDLVICRNVFIYMQPDAVASVSAKLASALVDEGYLIAGHGELLGQSVQGLRARVFPEAVIFRKSNSAEIWDATSGRPLTSPKPPMRAIEHKKPKHLIARIEDTKKHLPLPEQESEFQNFMQEAWACANRGQADAANHLCDRATVLEPFDPWPYYLKSQLAQESGEVRQAREMLDKVIYLDHSHIAAYIGLAALLDQEGNAARARKMRLAACGELRKMDPKEKIRPYESSSAAEILAYIELHLDERAVA